jgi:integrase
MSTLQFGSITIIVNGYTINNGLPYFQKAVPLALRSRCGKSTIKVRLHEHNGNYAVQCHRLDKQFSALFRAMKDDPTITPTDAKLAGVALLETAGLRPGDGLHEFRFQRSDGRFEVINPAQEFLQDFLTERDFSASATTTAAFAALDNKLPVLLSEAFPVYLDNHSKGSDKKFIDSQRQHWVKLVDLIGDIPIKAVTRADAKKYRDHRLASGVAPSTVKREINVLRAVFTKAIRELSLGIPNEFSGLEIKQSSRNTKDRIPYTKDEIQLLITEALRLDDEQRRIVLVLALTGARLAEIVGLRKTDFDRISKSIHIREHATRSVKTEQSNRVVPLLPLAFEAISKQAKAAQGDYLFPSYSSAEETNADSASGTLNKWAKKHVDGKTMHCFRHALRDLLRAVMCPESVAKEIGGWSSTHDVSVHYGQGYPLKLKLEWLEKAYLFIQI